jgi:hypothetical protein
MSSGRRKAKDVGSRGAVMGTAKRGVRDTFSWEAMKNAYPPDWPQISAAAKKRCNYKCEMPGCSFRAPPPFQGLLHAHHIRSAVKGNFHALSNIIVLCPTHHASFHKHMRGKR